MDEREDGGRARIRPWAGVLGWCCLCLLYLGLEATGLTEGLAFPVPLILALVAARALPATPRGRAWGRAVAVAAVVACPLLAVAAWRWSLEFGEMSPRELAVVLLLVGGLVAGLLGPGLRARLLRPLGLDPDSAIHAVVAVAAVLTLVTSAVLFRDLQSEAAAPVPFYPSDPLISLLGDTGLALAGVGLFISRGPRATLARLDVRPLGRRHVVPALALAALFHVVVGALDYVESVFLPGLHAREDRFDYRFVGLPPLVGGVLVSVAAGVGEEIVFRGALQPRIGVMRTAVLFAAVHVQYQVPGMLVIFLVGLGLGVVKQRTSTTFTALVHVVYDVGTFLLPDL